MPPDLAPSPAAATFGLLLLVGGVAVTLELLRMFRFRREDWIGMVDPVVERGWRWRDPALVLVVMLGAVQACAALGANLPQSMVLAICGCVQTVAIVVTVAVLLRERKMTWYDGFGIGRSVVAPAAYQGVVGCVAAWPWVSISSAAMMGLLMHLGLEIKLQDPVQFLMATTNPLAKAGLIALAVVLAPIGEELLFRGLLLPLGMRTMGLVPGVVVVSLVFAGFHGNAMAAGPLFVLAIALAVTYLHTGSLIAPIAMHAVFNAITVMTLYLTPSG